VFLFFVSLLPLAAQNASITGTVSDPQQAPIPNVPVTLTNIDMGIAIRANTDGDGNYEFVFVRPGYYIIEIDRPGFRAFRQGPIKLDTDQRLRVNVGLELGENTSAVNVVAGVGGVQTESSTLGTVTDARTILGIPLNGRFILDVALLTPGTVVPSTNNRTFLAVPSSVGISGINSSGTREDSTNYLLDGINLSDMAQNQITLQPNIDMVLEFEVKQNSFSAEYGRNAGIIVNTVTRPGSNAIHGSIYEFLRNQRFDAKNFFDPPGPILPFNRNIFGYSVGAPVVKNRTFFFTSYEGRVGLEVASIKTLVPSASQRAIVTNPIIRQLLTLVPAANDPTGTFFIGSAPRNRRQDQWSGRIDHNWSPRDFIFGSFIINNDTRAEPTLQGNNLPGFGDERPAHRYFLSLGYTRIILPNLTNELRAGLNRLSISFKPDFTQDPVNFGITTPSTVFPNVNVPGAMSFGGINGEPQGRGDTTYEYNDTIGWVHGKHSIRMGGEFRRFDNNNLNSGTGGVLTFGTIAAFLAGTPTQATQTSLPATPALRVNALGLFAQDDYKISARLTLNLGLRWEYNGVPYEKHDRLSIYDFANNSLVREGVNGAQPYRRQFTNFGPRLGFAYDPFGGGKTVVRGGFGIYYDQPTTNTVQGLGSNPPFSAAVNNTSNINLSNPFAVPPVGGSAINAIDPNFRDGMVISYNFNVQRETAGIVFQAAYVGSEGHHLRIIGDWNQGINGVRPISGFSSITTQQSVSNSNYNGLWLSANRRLARNLTFNTSYTLSKSIDNNSVGSSNPQVQDFRNLRAERALSDFDARNRFVLSAVYLMPFQGRGAFLSRLVQGWSVSPIVNLQSGNPFSPIIQVTDKRGSLEAFNRPFLVPGVPLILPNPSPDQWINPAAFVRQATGFGDAGRNILTGPGFADTDLSIAKDTKIRERVKLQFRSEAFNLFNHPNFGQPQNNLAVATFGQITATRTIRGDLGSSRQIQFALKLLF
jgi:Carboxypeptidase regulatory-like domain/TonB dependent receptor